MLPGGQTLLMTAARTGNPEVVKLLLDRGANPNAKESTNGETALMWAAAQNHPEAVRVLASHGADLNARSLPLQVQDGPVWPGRRGDDSSPRKLDAADVRRARRVARSR